MEKLKEAYEKAEIELTLFEFSDIVTASDALDDGDPNDWGDWT